jgi:CRISPR-associated protein Cas1
MSVLYVREHGSTIGVVNDRVQVRRSQKVVQEIPVVHIERIVLMVPVYITQPAVRFFMSKGIDIVYVSPNGRFYGQYTRGAGTNVELRLNQFRKFHDPEFRLRLASGFIRGKVAGMQTVWKRQRRHGDLQSRLDQLAKIAGKIGSARSLASLRGLEGSATAISFGLLRRALQGEWRFKRRVYNPPPDPVNAMLSLGYALLYSQMSGIVQMHGLDPYLGFFHEPKRGHAALASDLIEEWRCPLVDTLVLKLINNKQISPRDFETNGKRCTMARGRLEVFTTAFEERLKQYDTFANSSTDPVGGLTGQVRQLSRVLLDKQKEYAPVFV